MAALKFKQVDVFTELPFRGNPVAVVFGADDISDIDMQRIAHWTNLSETTFLQQSDTADYRLRIFSPVRELPFAGHPTIGSAHAAREAGLVDAQAVSFSQECRMGLIPLTVENNNTLFARVPDPTFMTADITRSMLADALGTHEVQEPSIVHVGPVWVVTQVADYDALYDLNINNDKITAISQKIKASGVCAFALDENNTVHVRALAPAVGVVEDPVCGSGNASVGAHIRATGLRDIVGETYTARQGKALGRDGYIHVRIPDDQIQIGGRAVTVVDGEITI
ncbi:MAG: PhzF family phenazine biosynthesis protein [candidate division Zixibacteria bacterium]|nr:PhzF family phenazine biosynthesis protein [candidate division Zixibacteria bacterium]